MNHQLRFLTGLIALSLFSFFSRPAVGQARPDQDSRPNFIVIVADDLGFSDIEAFGGDIPTPHLSEMAAQGTRFTQFYVSPTCSPTRAMLLSGMDNHLAGLGNMIERTAPNQEGQPGYEGVLNDRVAPLPAILKEAGYHTYMAGKWHLGKTPDKIPAAQGFERDFTLLAAAGSHFDKTGYDWHVPDNQFTEDGEYIEQLPKKYYSTRTFTDKIIEHIESNRNDGKPFFAYLAHQAPHDPLQVPDKWLRRHRGRYDCGWDSVRVHRLNRMQDMGLMHDEVELSPRLWYVPSFNNLTGMSRYSISRKMEIYASMVEYMDHEIGRLMDYLEETGLRENTYVIFMSDNGPESNDKSANAKNVPASQAAGWMSNDYDTDFASWGRKGSFTAYGTPWAQVSATPFSMVKGSLAEGGIRSPLIIVPPQSTSKGAINNQAILHVQDIAPTLLDFAKLEQPETFQGRQVLPMQGLSWKGMMDGATMSPRSDDDWLGFEFWGMRALRKGPWKILWLHKPFGTEEWMLFNVENDPGETHDLAKKKPEILAEMLGHWDTYVEENNVILPDRHQYEGLEDRLPTRPADDSDWPPGPEENHAEVEDDEFFECTYKKK